MILGGLPAAARFLPQAWRAGWISLILAAAGLAYAFAGRAPVGWIAALCLTLIARGGLWRLALVRGRPGPGGLQFGRIEIRLAAVWGLTVMFLAALGLIAFVVLLCGAYAAASAGRGFNPAVVATWAPAISGGGSILLGAIALLCAVGLAYGAARISLAEAASVGRDRIQVLSSFAMTRGRALALIVANLALAAPAIAMAYGLRGQVGAAAAGLALGALWLPMSVGLMAYAYEVCAAKT
jgi:hypothetical protein